MRNVTRLLVDARPALGRPTGIGRYTRELIAHWPDDRLIALVDKVPAPDEALAAPIWRLPAGPRFHVAAARYARRPDLRYWSPESLVTPSLTSVAALTVHDVTPLTIPETHMRRTVGFTRLLLGQATRSCPHIIVPTHHVGRELLRLFPHNAGKVHVVYEGVSPSFSAGLPPAEREPIILFLSSLVPRKNPLLLAGAFRHARLPGWRLVFAGKLGNLPPDEQHIFRKLVERREVEWLDYVSDGHLRQLLHQASVLAYPAVDEGFGLPVLEAMASGLPVLTTDAPALMEISGGAAYHVERSNLEAELERALRELMSDSALRQRLAERGLRRSRAFSWTQAAAEVRRCAAGEREPDY